MYELLEVCDDVAVPPAGQFPPIWRSATATASCSPKGADELSDEQRAAREQRLGAPLFALVDRAQAAGEWSRSLSPSWMLTVLGAVIVTAVREIAAGRLDRDHAPEIVTATLLDGYRHA